MTGTLVATLLSLGLMLAAGGLVLRALNPSWQWWGASFALWTAVLLGWTGSTTVDTVTVGALRSDDQADDRAPLRSLLGSPREVRRQMLRDERSEEDGMHAWLTGADPLRWEIVARWRSWSP
jgi:hypothetical protein